MARRPALRAAARRRAVLVTSCACGSSSSSMPPDGGCHRPLHRLSRCPSAAQGAIAASNGSWGPPPPLLAFPPHYVRACWSRPAGKGERCPSLRSGRFYRLTRLGAGFAAGCAYCAPTSAGGGLASAPVVSGALRVAARRTRHSLRFARLAALIRCVLALLVRAALPAATRSRIVRPFRSEVSQKNRLHCGLSLTPAFSENSPSDQNRRKGEAPKAGLLFFFGWLCHPHPPTTLIMSGALPPNPQCFSNGIDY